MTAAPNPLRKKLIEVSIPLEAINVASAREKSIRHGHPSTLHLWWARRPLAACRAVLFAQLVDDPSSWPDRFPTEEAQDVERRRLHKVIEAMVPWEASNDEVIVNAARWEIARSVAWGLGEEPPARGDGAAILNYLQTKAPPVYDPFSGGGSIPLEAQRLGLRAYGSDLNPVAVLIGKAMVEIPPKFAGRPPVNPKSRAEAAHGQVRAWKGAQGLAADVRYYGQWMRDEAEKRIGHLYPKATLTDGSKATVIAWLWARTVRSPDPAAKGAMVPLVSSFLVCAKPGSFARADVVESSEAPDGWRFKISHPALLSKAEEDRLREGSVGRKGAVCAITGSPIQLSYVRAEGRAGRLGARLMAIVADGLKGRVYLSPNDEHEAAAIARTEAASAELDQELSHNPRDIKAPTYGMTRWRDLFSPRQLLALESFSDLVARARAVVAVDALDDDELIAGGMKYADAVGTYLAFAVDKSANYWSSLCGWHTGLSKLISTFGRQAIPMVWDFAEANPFSSSSGNFSSGVGSSASSLEAAVAMGLGSVSQHDAQVTLPVRGVVVSTDPPYFDNIEYAELSDFFYAWLRRTLRTTWPDIFRRLSTPKDAELVAAPYRQGGKEAAERHFLNGMTRALAAIHEASSENVPVTIFYAFKQSEDSSEGKASSGWSTFLQGVVDAGFLIDGTWPVRTESTGNLKVKMNVLASSIVLVCRRRSGDAATVTRTDLIRSLKRELPSSIDAIRKAGVGPVDMQQSVIGPGMGVFSRHAKVLEDDDSAMSVKTALALINRAWEEIENELDQAFDPETQVALAWFATYGFDARASGELITLTTAKNTSDRALFDSGVFQDMKGKAALTPREKLPSGWSPVTDRTLTVWECVQHTARVLNAPDGGGEAAAALVAQMGPKAEEARALAYRLFEIATNKGWAAEALVYNQLAQEWTKLEDQAATLDAAGRAPGPNQSAFAFEGTA
jgi:putative DNA methylase